MSPTLRTQPLHLIAGTLDMALPELHASQRLLRKLGFREVVASRPDILRYELSR